MKITIEVNEDDVKRLIVAKLNATLGDEAPILTIDSVSIKVKSKNNYRDQQWEDGKLQVMVTHDVD